MCGQRASIAAQVEWQQTPALHCTCHGCFATVANQLKPVKVLRALRFAAAS
jgi:hypothetical protein